MKLTVIGGGGVRSMFLAKSIAQRARELDIDKLVFMDNDPEKLRVFGGMAAKVSKLLEPRLKFTCTTDAADALISADYVITTIRVGGDDMRVKDERIALGMGVLGQETTGAAGFSFAMRSIPALIGYCDLARKYSKPNVKVFNFTNPAGLVSQALRDAGYDFTYGICDAPSGMLRAFADMLHVEPGRVKGEIYGLNHLSFFNRIELDGKNILPQLVESDAAYRQTDLRYFSKELLCRKQFIPNEYLYYFFSSEKALANILRAEETRGEQIARINKEMMAALSGRDVENEFDDCLKIFEHYYGLRENSYMASETGISRGTEWRFNPFSKDAGGYAGVALNYMEIIRSGRKGSMILCTENGGAIPGLLDTDIVEATCDVTPEGCTPHRFTDFDDDALELIRRVKHYERKGARAILSKDRAMAVDALSMHPLVNSYTLGEALADAYIAHNAEYSPDWK
ncbi:MAG: 6-phospho-beta-glucosidase [Clostridia bacterium]|nr:6-phospho-beta-glucosidase [Clostridia bacterium]